MPVLTLTLTDYRDEEHWRWVLSDDRGKFLADHTVRLDPNSREYQGFRDLSTYLDYYHRTRAPEAQLRDLGAWVGREVFGGLRDALRHYRRSPATPVRVVVPKEAQALLLRPFELACFEDGTPFLGVGVRPDGTAFRGPGLRFVYQREGTGAEPKEPAQDALRILAAFSLPVRQNPLNLRRERYGLQRLVRNLTQVSGRAVELRVLQYGATRATLQEALEEGEGWDIVHLSGHGQKLELLLEDDRGGTDTVNAVDLGDLLDLARQRLKLLILDTCYSGAGSHAAARAAVGLDSEPTRQEGAEGAALPETARTLLPSLAQILAERLDCAALAMRYPVGDAFATDLTLSLYASLLDRGQALPAALQLALEDALGADHRPPPLSPATPILVGPAAADLMLAPPAAPPGVFALPRTGLEIAFPAEPERFVGRLQPMLRASQALAPHSKMRGVLFYGMPGAGKTACALELSYRHEHGRFEGYVWHRAPEADSEIAGALFNLMQDIQTQLNAPGLGLTTALDDPKHFRAYTLPRLRALLQQHALLLVLDNLETLLTESGNWRDPLWGDVVAALLTHDGLSRVVLTSRRQPAGLSGHPRLQVEAIHALSFAESVILARETPHLQRLFDDEPGRELLRQTLRVVQGHPKLLELADALAADRDALARRVATAADDLADRADLLDAFFAPGGDAEGETRQEDADFLHALQGWTAGAAAGLSPAAGLLFTFLCRLEPEDRRQGIVEANWKDFLTRLGEGHATAAAALAAPEQGLPAALAALGAAGLVAADRPEIDAETQERLRKQLAGLAAQAGQEHFDPADLPALLAAVAAQATTFTIHPSVAEAARAATTPEVLAAADVELGDYHIAMYRHGLEREAQGGGQIVVDGARHAAPYLLRRERWMEAAFLLERMLQRDSGPAARAFALPLLRRIAAATAGTENALGTAGLLARELWMAGRTEEADQMLRDLAVRSAAQGDYRLASAIAAALLNLLMLSGRLPEALAVAEEIAGYTRRAGLGPWSQLVGEGMRLQVLNAMGRYEEVLAAVNALRPKLQALSPAGEGDQAVNPWNARETLLNTGQEAAVRSEKWEEALAFSAEILAATQARGAGALEVARTRFNDCGPLLRLGRHADARTLLQGCRAVFEAERDVKGLGKVYTAMAELEGNTGGSTQAVRFGEVALAYSYQAGHPEDCASGHHNLANYLEREGADPATVLAHRLAAAVTSLQTQSGHLHATLHNLAISDLPPGPPSFVEVAERVEAVEGVRFRALFERLPRTTPDGDAALAAVWQLVERERPQVEHERQQREMMQSVLAPLLPPEVAAALESGNQEQLMAAFERLPLEQRQALLEQMRAAREQAGIEMPRPAGPDVDQVLHQFAPLLEGIAAAATDARLRPEIEALLPQLEEHGWRLTDATRRIWAGERDPAALTASVDGNSATLVRRVLELLEG